MFMIFFQGGGGSLKLQKKVRDIQDKGSFKLLHELQDSEILKQLVDEQIFSKDVYRHQKGEIMKNN